MAMTKKDYVAIAEIIGDEINAIPIANPAKLEPGRVALANAARKIADYAEDRDPKFKRAAFLQIAGVIE